MLHPTRTFLIIVSCIHLCFIPNSANGKQIQKRYLRFPVYSSMGYIVAIAVPVDVQSRNVFFSFTFEANYVLPSSATNYIPPWINGTQTAWQKRNLMNRQSIYRIIKDRLRSYGYAGRNCLLKMICDVSYDPIGEHNGLMGDLIQFILTPSASTEENHLPMEYYVSEERGKNGTGCKVYRKKCPKNVFKLFMEYEE